MPIGPARMPILDHLGELRRRCVIIVVCIIISVFVLYMVSPQMIQFLLQPVSPYLDNDGEVYLTRAFEGFSIKFYVSIFCSLVVCSPIIFWEILAFFLPALKPNERKYVLPTFGIAVLLFIIGVVFCYCFCLGAAFDWLTGETNSVGTMLPNVSDYVKFIVLFLIAFGIAFELPLVVFFLILFNIVPYKKMRANWRYVYVGLLVLSAMVTPDASPVTMGIMFAALLALYELSLALARVALGRKIKRAAEREAAEEAELKGLTRS